MIADYSISYDPEAEEREQRVQYWFPTAKWTVQFVEKYRLQRSLPLQRQPVQILFGSLIAIMVLKLVFPALSLAITCVLIFISVAIGSVCGFYQFMKEIYDVATYEDSVFPSYDNSGTPFNMMGVPLAVLHEFVQLCGGRSALQGLNTTAVCNQYMKNLTTDQSYCDHLKSRGDTRVQPANVFISHGNFL